MSRYRGQSSQFAHPVDHDHNDHATDFEMLPSYLMFSNLKRERLYGIDSRTAIVTGGNSELVSRSRQHWRKQGMTVAGKDVMNGSDRLDECHARPVDLCSV
jgi:hypothetical protein